MVSLAAPDLARRERSTERQQARRADLDYAAQYLAEHGHLPQLASQRAVQEWSRKSRARMVRTYCELDYTPLTAASQLPCVITLTLPGDWLTVAPSGQAFKRLVATFQRRWLRAWGQPLAGLWKLEFQRRGAPHLHVFTAAPMLPAAGQLRAVTAARQRPAVGDGLPLHRWLSVVWADVVAHPDPAEYARHLVAGTRVDYAQGLRMTDPKRVGIYFAKHGSFAAKEYQHVVPVEWAEPGQGPGRFWGYWQLQRVAAEVELTPAEQITAARTLRRYARAQVRARGTTAERRVRRGSQLRKVRRVPRRMPGKAGFVCVNDGPRLAAQLARYLTEVHRG